MKYVISLLFLLLGLYILFPLLHPGLYISHDGVNHVARLAAYLRAVVVDKQFPPQWAGGLFNHGYGSPLFLFFYPLPGYIGVLLLSLGLSLETCFKLIMGLSLIGMGFGWYIWMRGLFKDKKLAILSAIAYVVVPYHLLDVYVRGDIGEVLSFVFLPFVFWAFSRVSRKTFILGSLAYAGVLLSHNVMSLIFTPVIIGYGICFAKSKKGYFHFLGIIILGLGIAAFFWLPALIESKYLNTTLFIGNMYKENFLPLSKLLISQWGFGPDITDSQGLSAQLGIIYSLSVGASWIFLRKKFIKNSFVIFWSFVLLGAVFFALSPSGFVWSHINLMKHFQFPWRFIGLASFSLCVLLSYVLFFMKPIFRYVLITFLVVSILPYIAVQGYTYHTNSFYTHYSGTTYFHGEGTTVWIAGDPESFPKSTAAIIAGSGTIKKINFLSQKQLFNVRAKSNLRVVVNTIYFPGWKVFVDKTKVPIEFQDMNYRGLITFYVPSGNHVVSVVFTDTPIRSLAKIISIMSILILIGIIFYRKKHEKN